MSRTIEPPATLDLDARVTRAFDLDDIDVRDDGGMRLAGHAAVFDRLSEDLGGFRERIQRGAFRKVLDANADVRLLINHDPNMLLARTTAGTLELREDPKGLRVWAELADTTYGKDASISLRRRDMTQMSFAFRVDRDVWEEGDDGELTRTIVSFRELFDVSVVTFPAYPQTDAKMRSHACGVQIVEADGFVNETDLRDLAWRVHRGEVDATDADRDAIDLAFCRTDTVSPWTAQRAALAFDLEQELQGVVPGRRVTVMQDEPAPAADDGPHWRLAARQRRLRFRTT